MLRLALPGAWWVAAVFAAHTLHVDSVAWVIERKEPLPAPFFAVADLAWIRYSAFPGRRRYILLLTLILAAMLSKSTAATLPLSLLLCHC